MYEIERRTILWKMPLAAAAFMTAIPQVLRGGAAPLTWEEFTSRTTAVAKELVKPDGYDEDFYIYRVGAEAIGMPDVPATAKMGRYGKLDPAVEFGPAYRGAPIMIVQWRLAPHAWLPPHNHPNYNVITIGLEGEAVVTHYEVEGNAPPFDDRSSFQVRRTREMLIAPRRMSPLTSSRDNIHTFQAGPNGARGIDINTQAGKDIGFSFLDINPKPLDRKRATFAAKWIGTAPPEG